MKNTRILIVEDDEFSRGAMEKILESRQYDTSSCSTTEEAIIRLQEESFAILITDLRMQEMDGLELIKEARKIHPEILTILVTGLATEKVKLKAKEEGVDGFFSKPIEWDKLIALLEMLTRGEGSEGQNIKSNRNKGYSSLPRGIFIMLILFIFTMFFSIQVSEAQERFPQWDRPPLRMDSQHCWKNPSIGLTEEQIKAIKNLQSAYRAEAASKYRELMTSKIELQYYVSDRKIKLQDVIERHKRLLALQMELESLSFSYQMKARSLLTQEQLERLPQDCLLDMGLGYRKGIEIGIGKGPRRGPR